MIRVRVEVPLKVGGESERNRCKTELVRITSQISVGIAPPYLTNLAKEFTTTVFLDVNRLINLSLVERYMKLGWNFSMTVYSSSLRSLYYYTGQTQTKWTSSSVQLHNLQSLCSGGILPSIVPRPRPAFRRLQYGSDGKLGGARNEASYCNAL